MVPGSDTSSKQGQDSEQKTIQALCRAEQGELFESNRPGIGEKRDSAGTSARLLTKAWLNLSVSHSLAQAHGCCGRGGIQTPSDSESPPPAKSLFHQLNAPTRSRRAVLLPFTSPPPLPTALCRSLRTHLGRPCAHCPRPLTGAATRRSHQPNTPELAFDLLVPCLVHLRPLAPHLQLMAIALGLRPRSIL